MRDNKIYLKTFLWGRGKKNCDATQFRNRYFDFTNSRIWDVQNRDFGDCRKSGNSGNTPRGGGGQKRTFAKSGNSSRKPPWPSGSSGPICLIIRGPPTPPRGGGVLRGAPNSVIWQLEIRTLDRNSSSRNSRPGGTSDPSQI
mgnify:CR=1 FL=1